ncbi:MAG: SDR family oxidoreductase [Pseudomonadota bacterium]
MSTLIITGASSGIGLATAQRFLEHGHRVINLSRRPCPLDGVEHRSCDLADPQARTAVLAALSADLGDPQPLILIHNAALLRSDSTAETADEALRAVLEINLVAPNALNRALIPLMAPGSAIIYVGSTLSEKAVAGSFSYVTTKHASIGMMRATCQDLAGRQIHTACVCPGFTDTEMLRDHVPADALTSIAGMSTFGRLVEPAEIADTLHFTANAPVLNGAVVHANLGQIES